MNKEEVRQLAELQKKFEYIETSEMVLQLLHSLIDGNIITEISFPKSRGKNYTFYKYVRNPKYNNNWTLEKEL